jgi:16S rRNA (cytidine1402-2'-O)-methyltransferase
MTDARLYVVATPIGNLEDITRRALEVLSGVDLVAAEDTRRTRVLLTRHGLDKPLVSLQEHNERQKAPGLIGKIIEGASIALVSDAGTPLLSDPGYRLVSLAVAEGIEVVAVPGPSAITAALSISGLPTDRFTFEGFLPARQGARVKVLQRLNDETRTLVFFESSHRIQDCVADLCDVMGATRPVAVCREMTKQFETVLRGSLQEVKERIASDPDQRKGEFVIVVAGSENPSGDPLSEAIRLAKSLLEFLPASQAARVAARIHEVSRREVYSALD